jgi:hypothetical protein
MEFFLCRRGLSLRRLADAHAPCDQAFFIMKLRLGSTFSLPPTIVELKRILKLHLASNARAVSDTVPIAIADQ